MKSDAEEEAEEEAEVFTKDADLGWAWVFFRDKRLRRGGGAGTGVLDSWIWERSPTSLCLEKKLGDFCVVGFVIKIDFVLNHVLCAGFVVL